MALKRQEVQHTIFAGNVESLNYQVTNVVNQGWKLLLIQPLTVDRINGEFQFIYVFGKNLPDD